MPNAALAEQRGHALHIEKFRGDTRPRLRADGPPVGSVCSRQSHRQTPEYRSQRGEHVARRCEQDQRWNGRNNSWQFFRRIIPARDWRKPRLQAIVRGGNLRRNNSVDLTGFVAGSFSGGYLRFRCRSTARFPSPFSSLSSRSRSAKVGYRLVAHAVAKRASAYGSAASLRPRFARGFGVASSATFGVASFDCCDGAAFTCRS